MASGKFTKAVTAVGLRLGERLDAGGQGTVYRAQTEDDTCVAIKLLSNSRAQGRARFGDEISNMSRLAAAGCDVIPPILGRFERDDLMFFWMPYYPDGSLQKRLDAGDIADLLGLCRRLVEALGTLHQHIYAHRDLKPDNILFDRGRPLLADLGLALAADECVERRTAADEQVGGRRYMAPEMRDGKSSRVDQRPADLYSMAKILWCVLADKGWPFDREAEHFQTVNLPSTIRSQPALRDVERRLQIWMNVDPNQRTAVPITEMVDAIAEARDPRPAKSGELADPTVSERLQRKAAQYQVLVDEAERIERESTHQERQATLRRLERWLQNMREITGQATNGSPVWDAYCQYMNEAAPYITSTGFDPQHSPRPSYADQAVATRLPATSGHAATQAPFYDERPLWGVRIEIAGEPVRIFALYAELGTDEVILTACAFLDEPGWPIDDTDLKPVVESLVPLHASSESRIGSLAVAVLQGAVDYIVRKAAA